MKNMQCLTKILLVAGLTLTSWTSIAAATTVFGTPEECKAEAKKQDIEWGRQYTEQANCHAVAASNCVNPAHDPRFDDWVRRINALHNTCDAMRHDAESREKGDLREQAQQELGRQEAPPSISVATPYADSEPTRIAPAPSLTQQSDAPASMPPATVRDGILDAGDSDGDGYRASSQEPLPIVALPSQDDQRSATSANVRPPTIVHFPEAARNTVETFAASPFESRFCRKAREGEIKYRFFWRTIEKQSCYSNGDTMKRHDDRCCPDV